LRSLELDLEHYVSAAHRTWGVIRIPHAWPLDVVHADLMRREAYSELNEKAPELRALWLLRGDGLWRLGERDKAEAEFAAAVASPADPVDSLCKRAAALEMLGLRARADADLDAAARAAPDDPRAWVARGRLLAERGDQAAADVAYAHAVQLAHGRLDPFLAAGWWVVGPYPESFDSFTYSLETSSDPSQPVPGEQGRPGRWRRVLVNEDHYANLAPLAGRPSASLFAMTHLASDRERTALLCVGFQNRAAVWFNGRLVFNPEQQPTYHFGPEWLLPVTLRPGRNVLVVRVGHPAGGQTLRLRSHDFELDRAYLLAEFGRWPEAAEALDRAESRGQFLHPWHVARRADLLAALGRRDGYLRAAERLVHFDGPMPDDVEAARELALLPNTLVTPDRLIALAQKAIESNPEELWRKQPLGLAYYRAGRYREAISFLETTWPKGDGHEAPVRAMARWRLGNRDEARKALAFTDQAFQAWCGERARGRATGWLNWWIDGAQRMALRREAHELIDGKAPDDTAALEGVRAAFGNVFDNRESPTWAYEVAWLLSPDDAAVSEAYAARLVDLGRAGAAEPLLDAMMRDQADKPRALMDRGMLLARAGRPDRAASAFDSALGLVPKDNHPFGERARLCYEMATQPAAYQRLMTLRPNDALLWFARAVDRLTRADYNGAVADFVRGGEPPATTEFAFDYAAALLLAGDEPAYRRYVTRMAERHGATTETFTLFVLGRMAMLAERQPVRPDRMVAWGRKTAEQVGIGWYEHVLGASLVRAGDLDAATACFENSNQSNWGYRALNDCGLALVQLRRGRHAEARELFERARAALDTTPTPVPTSSTVPVPDWLEFQVLRKQIEGPLLDAALPAGVFAH
jgi:tetratricopeptide (TPR) repeat protein